jgi:hypothetical protein
MSAGQALVLPVSVSLHEPVCAPVADARCASALRIALVASAGGTDAAIAVAASAAGIRGAARATSRLTGEAARGAADALRCAIDNHPGGRRTAARIALEHAGHDVRAHLSGQRIEP